MPTEITHDDLVSRAETYLVNDLNCGFAFTEFHTSVKSLHGVPDAIGFRQRGRCSVLIECKTSRSDFLRDQKKPHRQTKTPGLGNVRYYMCPREMIAPNEVPDGWGLLECYAHGGNIAVTVTHGYRGQIRKATVQGSGYWNESREEAERAIMYSALRRLHLRGHIGSIYEWP